MRWTLTTAELSYNLSGTVRHLGLPVAGVTIVLSSCQAATAIGEKSLAALARVKTGPRGDFYFPLRSGLYCLEVVPDPSTRFTRQLLADIKVGNNVHLNVSLTTGLILQGSLRTASGGPYQGCEVVALGIEPSAYTATSGVDELGQYSLVLPRGRYQVFARSARQQPTADDLSKAAEIPFVTTLIDLVELDRDLVHDIGFSGLIYFQGRIQDGAGRPVAAAEVKIAASRSQAGAQLEKLEVSAVALSDPEGYFGFYLEPATYDLTIHPAESSALGELLLTSVEIKSEALKTFTLEKGHRLRGIVRLEGEPVCSALVKVASEEGKMSFQSLTGEDGSFSFGLPQGSYEVKVVSLPVGAASAGKPFAPWSHPVVVGDDTHLDVEVNKGQIVSGCVRDAAGNPRPGVQVSVTMDAGSQAGPLETDRSLIDLSTDESGAYALLLSPGQYWLFVNNDRSTAQPAKVENQPLAADLTWQGACLVRFEVVGEDGCPVPRCQVSYNTYGKEAVDVNQKGAGTSPSEPSTITSDNGLCQIVLAGGVYTFHFQPPSYSSYQARLIRQLSVSTDMTRRVKLPQRKDLGAAQIRLDFDLLP